MTYALVENGVVKSVGLPQTGVLKNGSTVSGYDTLSAAVLSSEGWLPLIDVTPAYNAAIETLIHDGYVVETAQVITRYRTEPIDVVAVRERKVAELSRKCNETILAGFASSALGSAHTYDFDEEAQRNLAGRLGIINANPNYAAVFKWKTVDAGPLDHTKAQFTQVCTDADAFKDAMIAHYWMLKVQVNAAADVGAVNAIAW
jgi:hypothetical protein